MSTLLTKLVFTFSSSGGPGGSDVTAPTLSGATGTATGETTASLSVSTNEDNGTLYWVVTTSSTGPSAAQVKAGQDHTGGAAADSGSQAVSSSGAQSITGGATGLTAATQYWAHYMHEDTATNQSTVATSSSFTTDAAAGSVITSIHHGSISLEAAQSTDTYTIDPAVDATKSIILWRGVTDDMAQQNTYGRGAVRLTLTNGTTVTATREQNTTNAAVVYFTVVEFASGVNSIQYGTTAITAGNLSNTSTITGVGSTAFVIWLGSSTANGGLSYSGIRTGVTLTNSTTVTANLGAVLTSTITTAWCVVDLDSTIVASIEQQTLTSTAASAAYTDTITSVDTTKSILVHGGDTTASAAAATTAAAFRTELTDATTVTFTRIGTGTTSRTHYYTVVTFASAALNSNIQRGTLAIAAATSDTNTITGVDTAKSIVNWGNLTATSANANTVDANLELTNTTTVTASVQSSGTATVAYEVVEFV